jgi:hypothetical protein
MDQAGASFEEASAQLSPAYGYFKIERKLKSIFSGYPTIDETLWSYEKDTRLGLIDFRRWANTRLAPYDFDDETQSECPLSEEAYCPSPF